MDSLEEINKEIESVIERLKELETPKIIKEYGIEKQENIRKLVTQIFRDLLFKKEELFKK